MSEWQGIRAGGGYTEQVSSLSITELRLAIAAVFQSDGLDWERGEIWEGRSGWQDDDAGEGWRIDRYTLFGLEECS